MKSNLKIAIFYILLIGGIIIMATALLHTVPSENLTYSEVIRYFREESVKSFVIDEDNELEMVVRVTQQDGTRQERLIRYKLRDINLFLYDLGDTVRDQLESGVIESQTGSGTRSS